MQASDARVNWSGRRSVNDDASVTFDWLGVSTRIAANKASWISAVVTTDSERRGTRLKVYTSDQGFLLYPQTAFWVSEKVGSTGSTRASNSTILAMPNGGNNVTITLENMVDPQYRTGKTTIHSFDTDGVFVAVPAANLFGGPQQNRRIEFIGDSITAATNVVRPEGAPTCGDGGYQSDWSQSYEALLCHRFGASCSTVAVGGKCVMKECGGLQMPDYFQSAFYHDAPSATYNFKSGWQPDAMVIDLGTNDNNVISKLPDGVQRFVNQTVDFMKNAVTLYGKDDIEFFLTGGPMENVTVPYTQAAVQKGVAEGLKVTFVDMQAACWKGRYHGIGNSDWCDGCASHPGIEGHRGMYEAAWPVIKEVMGWD